MGKPKNEESKEVFINSKDCAAILRLSHLILALRQVLPVQHLLSLLLQDSWVDQASRAHKE